ncbi:deoxynucleoside kinase [Candidatus Woesearchaeota archaeon]|jgi:thymidylate kinase|nr:deoxynucleoside kinase [Candidatus Woesearchaeota archaeon]
MPNQLISLEGISASGKTSIAKALEEKIGAHYIHSPPKEYEEHHEAAKELGTKALYNFYLGGNRHVMNEINGFLQLGQPVIIEPYIYSTIAFGLLNRKCQNPPPCISYGPFLVMPPGLLEPDQIIYVTASWGEIEKRLLMMGKKRNNNENIYNLKKFKEVYDQVLMEKDNVIIVDTTRRNVDEVVEELLPKLNLL